MDLPPAFSSFSFFSCFSYCFTSSFCFCWYIFLKVTGVENNQGQVNGEAATYGGLEETAHHHAQGLLLRLCHLSPSHQGQARLL